MKNNDKRQLDNNFIEQKVAEAFGYSDEQLAEELDRLMEEAEKSQDKALEAPEGEFERIWSRVERGHDKSRNKGSRVKRLVKVMGVAAALGMMLFGGSMWVGAKRYYVNEVREREDLENVIAINNSPDNLNSDEASKEKIAYEQIKEELNIEVLELSYLPDDMTLIRLKMFKTKGRLEFVRESEWLFFYQGLNEKPSSLSYASDMDVFKYIYNPFLAKDIPVYQKQLENGDIEFSVRIITGNSYYIMEGIIDFEDFTQIVCGIKPYDD